MHQYQWKKANTEASFTVTKYDVLQKLSWVKVSPTSSHITGCCGIAEPSLGKATVKLQMAHRSLVESTMEQLQRWLLRINRKLQIQMKCWIGKLAR